ncbi:cupin-like domain-containing protein [Asticcacaulis sp. MM231]|uniref:cupin-like domain-containing protein n=1 Tax=Asticcacaulis sp. MM231 TaxID=3157666 RepID=UPI0032D5A850
MSLAFMTSIPSISANDLSQAAFDKIVGERQPVVLRAFAGAWPSVKAAISGDEALCQYLARMSDKRAYEVLVAPPSARGLFFYEAKLQGFNFNRQNVPLCTFLDHLLALRNTLDAPTLYLQSTPTAEILPAFQAENPNTVLGAEVGPRAWIGNATRIATHYDVADNVAVVVAGRRRFTLFPPDQVSNLYVGPLDFTLAGQPVSLADPDAPDFERFPRFRQALDVARTAELDAGDAIYIPSPWWHSVAAMSQLNMLVNYWWRDYPTACGTPFNWLVHGLLSVRHLPKAERDAWRAMVDHYVFEDHGDPAAHIPVSARSVLGTMSSDLARHLKRWLAKEFSK